MLFPTDYYALGVRDCAEGDPFDGYVETETQMGIHVDYMDGWHDAGCGTDEGGPVATIDVVAPQVQVSCGVTPSSEQARGYADGYASDSTTTWLSVFGITQITLFQGEQHGCSYDETRRLQDSYLSGWDHGHQMAHGGPE
ncbi:hypothetical protein LCGC14_2316080 [marine sediment metagenome]|uniref:Uncharacterized protein n=1 Tax=marine sediment metagenome TaxID=412755 RepID=A0A0F9EWN0_9ZZZZ